MGRKYSAKSNVFTILTLSVIFTCMLTMAVTSQVAWGAALGAPTGITQCKPATTTTITLCWVGPTVGGNPKIESYHITNSTEVCTGSGGDFTCSFPSGYNPALSGHAAPNAGGTNQTGGTGSAVTVANFTGLSAGVLYKFKIFAVNDHGNGTSSSAFQAGTLMEGSVDWSERPAQTFGNGTTFGDATLFAADQDFANFQNFGEGQVFGSGSGFAQDQTFNGTQNFSAASIKFDSGTDFDTAQTFGDAANFTGATTFTGSNTFGDSAVFGKGANFKSGTQTFGSGGNFSGVFEMIAGNTFGASTYFAKDQPFVGAQDFSASGMKFDSGTTFDTVQTFGESMNFTGATTFTGTNNFAANAVFGKGATFPASQTFGKGMNFTGIATFSGDQTFGQDAEFAAEQTFASGTEFTFDDFSMFNQGTDFGKARTFDPGAMFDSSMTFYADSVFSESAMFGDSQAFSAAMTFGQDNHFGTATDFTALAQTFAEGTTFGADTTFAVGQVMPLDTVPSHGMMLAPYTCEDAACVPPASLMLAPGEFIPPGTDPAAVSSSVSADDPSVSIPGLGFTMNFTSVSGTGKTTVDPIDPNNLPGSADPIGDTSGSRAVVIGSTGTQYDSFGTALDLSTTADASGNITVELPYVEANIPAGTAETDLIMMHFVDGEWKEETSCTLNAGTDKLSCIVTSLSPFSLGFSASPGAGGTACNANGYGAGKSLALYEISWDILEANEVQVIAGSTCGPIAMQVFTQNSISSGGLSQDQPYVSENKVVISAPLNISVSDSFRITLENGWNTFEQTVYPELQGSSGTILLNFQQAHYSKLKVSVDEETQLADVPSSEVFMDPEPQAILDAEPQLTTELEPQPTTDAEPQLTTEQNLASSAVCGEGTGLTGGVCVAQEKKMGFWDWLFSLFF